MNVNAYNKCMSIWGDFGELWSVDVVMGQYWRDSTFSAMTTWEAYLQAMVINSSSYCEESRDGIGTRSSNTALGFSQPNDAVYFSGIKDEHHEVIVRTKACSLMAH